MLKLNHRSTTTKRNRNQGLSAECRQVLEQVSKTPTSQLQRISGSPRGLLLLRKSPQKSKERPNVKTTKYIGVYNNVLGILTSKSDIPQKQQQYMRTPHIQLHPEPHGFVINRYMIPHKLGSCRKDNKLMTQ